MQFTFSDRVNSMQPSIIRELLKQTSDPSLISFAGGNPAAEAFPVEDIRLISNELLHAEPVPTLQYSITEGYPPLLQAGERYLNRRWQVKKEGDALLVTSGSQQAMDFMTKLLCNEGDLVATEDPAFLGALNSFRSYRVQLAGVPMQADGADLAALEQILAGPCKPRFYYTIPNFQNPTGVTTSLEKRRAVYELCTRYGVPVLEDDPYGELRTGGEALPPIKHFDTRGTVVYAASMSKILAPGLRIGFCVGAQELIAKMVVAKQVNDVHSSMWAQRVCERFLTRSDLDAHLERLRGIYREKAALMMAEVDRQLGARVRYTAPQGGMFLWLTLPADVDMPEFVRRCLANKLAVVPGNAFFVDETQPCHSVRLNFSTPTPEQIRAGVGIMAAVLDGMAG